MKIEHALYNLATDPDYPQYNYELGRVYESMKQYAAAISFYLRAAELSNDTHLSYDALLRIYFCFKALPDRMGIAEGVLQRAVSLIPNRPEAYFLLSQHHEIRKQWQLSYTWASVGAALAHTYHPSLQQSAGYYGPEAFTFQKAVSAWWIGLYTEAFKTFKELRNIATKLPEFIISSIDNNLATLTGIFTNHGQNFFNYEYPHYLRSEIVKYHKSLYPRFKFKFPGLENIKENYSQAYQDLFILAVLNGKKDGCFVEIGSNIPIYNSNTYLLESQFNWYGVSIDFEPKAVELFNQHRREPAILMDATKINYRELFKERQLPKHIDYLQVDCEPATTSYDVLKLIPFDEYKFAVITFEHDHYVEETDNVRDLSRNYLKSFGYVLLVNDVSTDNFSEFEDWWIHPNLVSSNVISQMYSGELINRIDKYMVE